MVVEQMNRLGTIRRNRFNLITLMLEATISSPQGVRKSDLMYSCFLSHSQVKAYAKILEERGLLDYHEEHRIYTITDKGRLAYHSIRGTEVLIAGQNLKQGP
jgi:predicted transcriptional regulator